MKKIIGGYVLQPRSFDESEVSKFPPHVREIFLYLIRKANHKNVEGKKLARGQLLTSYKQIISDLSWYVGYRKESYKKHHCETAMKLLTKLHMITTTKTTRGMIVTVCNYDIYQNPERYETDKVTDNETTSNLQSTDRIDKNEKNVNNNNKVDLNTNQDIDFEKFIEYFNGKAKGKIPLIIKITDTRKKLIRSRLKQYGKNKVIEVIDLALKSKSLTEGIGASSWKASFDWIMKENNFIKIMEGNYNNQKTSSGGYIERHEYKVLKDAIYSEKWIDEVIKEKIYWNRDRFISHVKEWLSIKNMTHSWQHKQINELKESCVNEYLLGDDELSPEEKEICENVESLWLQKKA